MIKIASSRLEINYSTAKHIIKAHQKVLMRQQSMAIAPSINDFSLPSKRKYSIMLD